MAELSGGEALKELAESLKEAGLELDEKLNKKMLRAGAEVIKNGWKKAIRERIKHPDRSTNALVNSIKVTVHGSSAKDLPNAVIAPSGKDSKGVRNAVKAYVMHYGRKNHGGKYPGNRFVDIAEDETKLEAVNAMADVFYKYLEKKQKSKK